MTNSSSSPTTSELARFAQEFKDEEHLRTALSELLQKTGAKGVLITHGRNERGKDIIFYKPGGLSGDVLYACVVKNDRITGRADAASGARTVLNQALQALTEPHTNRSTGIEERVHTAYVMCPHDCTSDAIESIKGELRERARQVEFICGIDLLALFQQHWPDFLRFHSGILTRYLADLSVGLSVDQALIALLTRHNANLGIRPFEAVYVPNAVEVRIERIHTPEVLLPWPHALDAYCTREELEDLSGRLRFWRAALRSPELTWTDEDTLEKLRAFIANFRKEWKPRWDRALQTKRNRDSRGERLEERRLEFSESEQKLYESVVEVVTGVHEELTRIQRAASALHQRVTAGSQQVAVLTDPDLLRMSTANDYLHGLPGLLRASSMQTITLKPETLFNHCKAVMLVGPPGSGKTSFCRWQTLQAIEQFASDPSKPLPVYVPAHRLAATECNSFETVFLGGITLHELQPNAALHRVLPIRLFVDGLDEIPDRNQQRRLIHLLQQGLQTHPGLVVVITARPYVWGNWLNWLPRVYMADLQPAEQAQLTRNWLTQEQHDAFLLELGLATGLHRLMRVPLLATLMLNLYRKTPALPESKSALYRAFIDLYCGGWDAAKGVFRAGLFRSDQKLRPLSALAHKLHLSHRTDCSEHSFTQTLAETLPGIAMRANEFLTEIIQDGILVRAGEDLLFAHLSFQEFLAASYLASDPAGQRAAHSLRSFLQGDDWWKEVVEFYISGLSDPTAANDWIRRAVSAVRERGGNTADLEGRLEFLDKLLQDVFPGFTTTFN